MLAEVTPEQFEEWFAYWRLEPWDVRSNTAQIVQETVNGANGIICTLAHKEWKKTYAMDFADCLLGRKRRKKRAFKWR